MFNVLRLNYVTLSFYKNKNNWDTPYPCNIEDGAWVFYNIDGTVKKTETYLNGSLINTK